MIARFVGSAYLECKIWPRHCALRGLQPEGSGQLKLECPDLTFDVNDRLIRRGVGTEALIPDPTDQMGPFALENVECCRKHNQKARPVILTDEHTSICGLTQMFSLHVRSIAQLELVQIERCVDVAMLLYARSISLGLWTGHIPDQGSCTAGAKPYTESCSQDLQ